MSERMPRPGPRHRPARDELAGTGRTALSPEQAMRARDLDRPTEDDLARAERELTIVRRNWKPPS